MKITQINTTYGDGDSTGRTTKEMHEWLQKNGYDSMVFCASVNDGKKYGNRVKKFSNRTNQIVHAALSRITGLQGYFSIYSTKRMLEHLNAFDTDIVILRVLHSNCINLKMILEFLGERNIPTIIVLHDCWYYTGHCTYYTYHNCDKWKNICNHCQYIKKDNVSLFFDTSCKCFNDKKKWFGNIRNLSIVGVSKWIAEEAKQSFLGKRNICSIYNWVDTDVFDYTRVTEDIFVLERKKYKHILLGVASKWSYEKGINTIYKVARENKNDLLVLIGSQPEGTPADIENIKFVGKITDKRQLAKYYSSADAFINPSKQETFGKTTAEAFSCGTPVIAFAVSASAELVESSRGYKAEANDIDFINGIKKVLNNGKHYYQNACRQFAVRNFNIDKNMRKYTKLFASMVEE